MEPLRWKAFLRLTGQTLVDDQEDVLKEFKRFVSMLARVGIEYSIILNIEPSQTERFNSQTREQSTEQSMGGE